MTGRLDLRGIALGLAAPALALAVALAISSAVLILSGDSPLTTYRSMLDYGSRTDSLVSIANRAVPYYLSGIAVAIGFKMGLFNIGVEGQYRVAGLLAAAAGAAVTLPGPLHVLLIVVVAMAAGAAWAGIAGLLKTTRGVSEVISTIMLNFVAIGLTAYLLSTYLQEERAGSLDQATPVIPESGRVPGLNGVLTGLGFDVPQNSSLWGLALLAVLVGAAYWVLVWRTRFGFDLRAAGANPAAAQASGVDARAMTLKVMLLSGAVAGLVGLPQLLGASYRFAGDFPSGLGFTGIAIALLGRNHPIGIALGALLFGFLERSSQILDLEGIPKEIVVIMQGSIVLSVVVAYEVVRRVGVAQQERAVRREVPV